MRCPHCGFYHVEYRARCVRCRQPLDPSQVSSSVDEDSTASLVLEPQPESAAPLPEIADEDHPPAPLSPPELNQENEQAPEVEPEAQELGSSLKEDDSSPDAEETGPPENETAQAPEQSPEASPEPASKLLLEPSLENDANPLLREGDSELSIELPILESESSAAGEDSSEIQESPEEDSASSLEWSGENEAEQEVVSNLAAELIIPSAQETEVESKPPLGSEEPENTGGSQEMKEENPKAHESAEETKKQQVPEPPAVTPESETPRLLKNDSKDQPFRPFIMLAGPEEEVDKTEETSAGDSTEEREARKLDDFFRPVQARGEAKLKPGEIPSLRNPAGPESEDKPEKAKEDPEQLAAPEPEDLSEVEINPAPEEDTGDTTSPLLPLGERTSGENSLPRLQPARGVRVRAPGSSPSFRERLFSLRVRRMTAGAIDGLIWTGMGFFIYKMSIALTGTHSLHGTAKEWLVLIIIPLLITTFLFVLLYESLFAAGTGRTPGMFAARIRVQAEEGGNPSLARAFFRTTVLLGGILLGGAGLVSLLLGPGEQGFHDRVAGTKVIK